VRLAPEGSPIKRPPMPVLQINKNRQDAEHHYAGQNAFLIHEKGKLRSAAPHAKWETATQR